jgi:hypothetical protein
MLAQKICQERKRTRIYGSDSCDHLSIWLELVNVWTILIADPESSVVAKRKTFTIDGDCSLDSIPVTPSITKKRGSREGRESRVGNLASGIGIKSCTWSNPIRPIEKGGIFVSEDKIGAGGSCDGSTGLGCKCNPKFVDPGLVVYGALSIPFSR